MPDPRVTSARRTQADTERVETGKARNPCPHCRAQDNEVVRVRCRTRDGVVVRRHLCICGRRFTSEQRVRIAS